MKDFICMVLGVVIGLSLFFYMFIGAVIQTSERICPAQSEIYIEGGQR